MAQSLLIIVSAPSGTGKSTLCRELLKRNPSLKYSISCTTRPPRKSEEEGRDYFFTTPDEFQRRVDRGDFLEWAKVHGCLYGTPKRFTEETLRRGWNVLLAIDVQGALSIREKQRDAVLIFVVPPSWESLESRLRNRDGDSRTAEQRLAAARNELQHFKSYDYLLVNDRLEETVEQMESIILSESLRVHRREDRVQVLVNQ